MAKADKYAHIRALILVYLVLTIIGFIMLQFPGVATRQLTGLESLFTTISALTLTGLQVCDFATLFTQEGQIMVLILIQLGAITIVSFSLYFGWLMGKGFVFSDSDLLTSSTTSENSAYFHILKKTVFFLFAFELICSGILYAFWTGDIPLSPAQKLNYAVFHGVSVFCHSGFSNLDGNFNNAHFNHSYIFLLAVTGVILLGSVGYAAIFDLISVKRLRERMIDPKRNWTLQTRIALFSTLILVGAGSIFWYITEQNNALSSQKLVEASIKTLFNVSGARGAGFYSVKLETLSSSLVLLYMFLMLIGVSASSPGGGLKTSAIYAAFFIKSKPIQRAAKFLFVYAAVVLLMSLLIMDWSDALFSNRSLRFEVISAFSNTGLSFGITPHLSLIGKYVLIADMILGRIGIPVVVYLLMKSKTMNEELLLS